jgi:hypothetical protein
LIIIGMHRSGTTMVAQMLTELGLFQGQVKDHNHEPVFFVELNEWLLRLAGGAWDYPLPFKLFLKDRQLCKNTINFISSRLDSSEANILWGVQGKWFRPGLAKPPEIWGWKDPRNTFTLPLWLELFPKARVIHVYRHGVDVAASLIARTEKVPVTHQFAADDRYKLASRKPLFHLDPLLTYTVRCSSLEDSFSLWEEYMAEATYHVSALGSRCHQVCYENILASPEEGIAKLIDFCGLAPERAASERMAKFGRKSRGYSYREKPELVEFAKRVSGRLSKYGY